MHQICVTDLRHSDSHRTLGLRLFGPLGYLILERLMIRSGVQVIKTSVHASTHCLVLR